jgi:transposase
MISDILGTSGRMMIEALIAGETDPTKLAGLASTRIKASPTTLTEALRGRVTRHHRFLLRLHLEQIDTLDRAIAEIDTKRTFIMSDKRSLREVEAGLDLFRPLIPVLTSIPGIGVCCSPRLVLARAGIGTDMSRFPTAGHLISWAGLCPKNDESAGKRRSNRMRKGAPWLKTTLIQCASWRSHAPHGRLRRAAISKLSSTDCARGAAPRRLSAQSQPLS